MSAVVEEFGGIDVSGRRHLGEVQKGYTAFVQGDVLFAKITPCMENGKIALVPPLPDHIAYGSTEFQVLRANGVVASKWLAHFVVQSEFRRLARRNMTGSAGQMRVPTSWLAAAPIPVAPLREQHRIVEKLEELLCDLDAGVAELRAAQAKLKVYRQSLLKAAVTGELTAEWRQTARACADSPRTTGAELVDSALIQRRRHWEQRQRQKSARQGKQLRSGWQSQYVPPVDPDTSNLAPLPDGWAWASLDMLGEIASGVAKGSKIEPGTEVREVPYLRVANVQRGFLDLSEVKTIPATERDIADLRLEPGDVLFNEGGDRDKLGRGWVWEGQVDECIHQNHVFRVRPYLPELLPELISHHGNTFGKLWFQQAGKQTTNLASINLSILRSFPVPVAPPEEQRAIRDALATCIPELDAQEQAVELTLRQSEAQRKNILQAAFSGQLVPQDPNDEPASVLLERIRASRAGKATAPTRRPRKTREPA